MRRISVGIVDHHPITLEAIVGVIGHNTNLEVLGTGAAVSDVLQIATRCRPDVLIIEVGMPGNAFEAITNVIGSMPTVKVVAFTFAAGVATAIRALDAGAVGFVLKAAQSSELIEAIEAVARGENYITRSFASQVIAGLRDETLRRKAAAIINLSIREEQIVRLLVRGSTNKEIAARLKLSDKTVKHYMTILMQKMNARNRLEVVVAAQKMQASNFGGHALN
ncbi:LuxR C-terminal-related transcriptional regulator [Bradyrhizobium symbiodeficiens]|uniref:Response regulator transcription factor n=1 Tax=Bradyrhizobium symbiodeficiens TaxID=1404367 RepID=A0A6G9ABW1_9BRAD|nr:response regulator transcription factor [Bradyrhizobium symbiodeficiens]QIP09816.1 response regulator transcription factor [Bradyrhizobium symbiodeficiens]